MPDHDTTTCAPISGPPNPRCFPVDIEDLESAIFEAAEVCVTRGASTSEMGNQAVTEPVDDVECRGLVLVRVFVSEDLEPAFPPFVRICQEVAGLPVRLTGELEMVVRVRKARRDDSFLLHYTTDAEFA